MGIERAREQNAKNVLDDNLFVYIEGSEPGSKGRKFFEEAIEYITSRPTENFKVYYKTSSTARNIQLKSKAYLIQYVPWAHKIEFEKNRARARTKESTRVELAKLRQLMPNP